MRATLFALLSVQGPSPPPPSPPPPADGAAPPPAIVVASEERCPAPEIVSRRLDERLGPGAAGREGWRLRYLIRSDANRAGRTLELRLEDPAGAPRLERAVAITEPGCGEIARAIALIVERHVRALGWTAGRPLSAPAPAAVTAGAARAEGAPARQAPPRARRLVLESGAGLWHRSAWSPGVAVAARLEGARVALGLATFLPPDRSRHVAPAGGSASSRAWPIAGSLLVGMRRGPGGLFGGLAATVSVEPASASGIPAPRRQTRLALAAGPAALATIAFAGRFRLSLDGALERGLLANPFVVEGWGRVLPAPTWQGRLALRAGIAFDL